MFIKLLAVNFKTIRLYPFNFLDSSSILTCLVLDLSFIYLNLWKSSYKLQQKLFPIKTSGNIIPFLSSKFVLFMSEGRQKHFSLLGTTRSWCCYSEEAAQSQKWWINSSNYWNIEDQSELMITNCWEILECSTLTVLQMHLCESPVTVFRLINCHSRALNRFTCQSVKGNIRWNKVISQINLFNLTSVHARWDI